MKKPHTRLSTKVLFRNPWWKYCLDRFVLPNGKEGDYHYLHSNSGVCVVAVATDGRIHLQKQFRYLFQRESLELPGGGIKETQTPEEAVATELAEEAGLKASRLQMIGKTAPLSGLSNEWTYVFLATDLTPTIAQPDESEEFTQFLLTPAELEEKIASGEIWDGHTITAWTLAKPWYEKWKK